jgi:hypothetical protein
LWFALSFLEILLNYERYSGVYTIKNFINKTPLKLIIGLVFLTTAILFIPDYLSVEIVFTGVEGIYMKSPTDLGKQRWYTLYYVGTIAVIYIVGIVFVTTFTILNIRGIKMFIARKNALVQITVNTDKKNKIIKKTNIQKGKTQIVSYIFIQFIVLFTLTGNF